MIFYPFFDFYLLRIALAVRIITPGKNFFPDSISKSVGGVEYEMLELDCREDVSIQTLRTKRCIDKVFHIIIMKYKILEKKLFRSDDLDVLIHRRIHTIKGIGGGVSHCSLNES